MSKSLNLNLNIDVDVAELIKTVSGLIPTRESYSDDQTLDGGNARWISCQYDGKVISACYHKSKNHSATVQTGLLKRQAKSSAPAGKWAVAMVNSEPFGVDRTFYNY